MAAVSDCFSIGSTVACTTCFKKKIEGEVLAFDPHTKMLILIIIECETECPSSDTGKQMNNDVYILNLALCSDVTVIKECSTIPEPPQSLNLQRLSTRVRNAVEQKRRLVSALAAGVSPEGQNLYMSISKTINNQVIWSGQNIVVFKDVTITPPYKVENVTGNPDSRQLAYVKKIVDKFAKDQAAAGTSSAGSSSSTPSNNTTTTTTPTTSSTSNATVSAN